MSRQSRVTPRGKQTWTVLPPDLGLRLASELAVATGIEIQTWLDTPAAILPCYELLSERASE